jgi:hypothetical protein
MLSWPVSMNKDITPALMADTRSAGSFLVTTGDYDL